MSGNDKEIIEKVLKKVAEEFAFMFVDEPRENIETVPPYVKSKISFSNHIQGIIEMIAPMELCKVLVSNVLGIDSLSEEDEQTGVIDALCEFLNIFCGNFITEKLGMEAIYNLRPPLGEIITEVEWEQSKNNMGYSEFVLDDFPLLVRVIYV